MAILNATMLELTLAMHQHNISARLIKFATSWVIHKPCPGCQKHRQYDTQQKDLSMATFAETIEIDAPATMVWDTLADIGTIADWNPGLIGSHATNDITGLGATRYCDIDGKQNLNEEIIQFDPMHTITFRITRSTLPFRAADIRFTLRTQRDKTIVTVSPIYVLKYGLVGRVLDRVFVSAAYQKGMRGLLSGLKRHAEEQGSDKRLEG